MHQEISQAVAYNSFDYFEKTLITDNGFREYDVRWILGKEINPNGFLVLGKAFGTFLQETVGEKKVIVGHDFRAYSQDLCRSFVVGLLSTGMHVVDIGLALTPMLYFAQHHLDTRAGAMVTASHNENGWTGIKLADGLSSTLGPAGISQFKEIVKGGRFCAGQGTYELCSDLFGAYADDLIGYGALVQPLKVVVAAGNGTAGRFAPAIIRRLGCEVIEVDCNPDWNFPQYNPNPEDVAFLENISSITKDVQADLGIGFDGDGDRIGVVDNLGREIYSDRLGLLVARWICSEHPGRSVVVDVKSTGLFFDDPILRQTGTEVIMWKTGHSYIKQKVAEIRGIAGFEKSGHWFFNSPYGRGYDDGLLSAVHLLHLLARSGTPLSEMVNALPLTWQSPTLGVYCADEEKYEVASEAARRYQQDLEAGATIAGARIKDIINVNGVRFILEDDGWGLIRASSNKPSLVIVGESRRSEDQLYDIMDHIQTRLKDSGKIGEYDQKMPKRSRA